MQPPLLILDLDETLIYGTTEPLARMADFRVADFHVYRRPHLEGFLQSVAASYRLAMWTGASSEYARQVVAGVMPTGQPLEFVWSRKHCKWRQDLDAHEEFFLKDLTKLRRTGHDLDRIVFVDDTAKNLSRNYGNHLPIAPFTGALDDAELPSLARYLQWLATAPNLCTIEKRSWRLHASVTGHSAEAPG